MDLNDFHPYGCVSDICQKEVNRFSIDNTQYYQEGKVPEVCPFCQQETLIKLVRVCLVYGEKKGKFKASEKGKIQNRVEMWTYFCGRSNDEHNRNHIVKHTCVPSVANCPECLAKYKQNLELAGSLLRVKE